MSEEFALGISDKRQGTFSFPYRFLQLFVPLEFTIFIWRNGTFDAMKR